MNKLLLFLILCGNILFAQIGEGQKFCSETKGGSYFPIDDFNAKKKIFWAKTFYVETKEGSKTFNGKVYTEFKQLWENGEVATLYMREQDGVVYQYLEELKKDVIRYNAKFKVGDEWFSSDGKDRYKIISYLGELRTPYCEYKGLLVVEANVTYGKFKFYYLKGQGYIGATKDEILISCLTPE